MNIIQRALISGRHRTDNKRLEDETWKEFKKSAANRKLFLFGGTKACDYFLDRYGDKYDIEYILDNAPEKSNRKYMELSSGKTAEKYGELVIKTPDILTRYCADEVLVMITSTNYHGEIAGQLEDMGIYAYYSLCVLEGRRWNNRMLLSVHHIKAVIREKIKRWEGSLLDRTGWNREYIKRAMLFLMYRKYPVNNQKIVFHTFDTYMDHGKYIAEKLMEEGVSCDIVWLVGSNSVETPAEVRKVLCADYKNYIYELATAKVWINDMPFPIYVRKRKGQYYIQTKHWSSITLKKFYLDAPSLLTVPGKVKEWKYNGKIMDYIITGSQFDTESCRRGFRFKGQVWQVGSPRTDAIFKMEDCRRQVYEKYGISKDRKLLLYAPTYRFVKSDKHNRHEMRGVTLDFQMLNEALEERFGGKWNILLRLHPSVKAYSREMRLPEYVIDAGDYDDSQELAGACDIMVSDYSSIMFEPCFAGRAVFLYAPDWQQYIEEEYELLIDLKGLPFPIAESNEALAESVREFNQELYRERVKSFLERFGVKEDGAASRRAADRIRELLGQ